MKSAVYFRVLLTVAVTMAASVLLVPLVGCGDSGPARYGVFGTVTFNGKPVEAGSITFLSANSKSPVAGSPITDGKYEVPEDAGLLAGDYLVSISYPDPKAPPVSADQPPGDSSVGQSTELLPAKYNRDTTLKATVGPDSDDELNFALN